MAGPCLGPEHRVAFLGVAWGHGGRAGLGLWPGEGCGSCSFLSGPAVSLGCSPRSVFGCHRSGCQTGRAVKKLQRNETPGSSQPFLPPPLPLPSPSSAHTSLLSHTHVPARGSTVLAPASPPSQGPNVILSWPWFRAQPPRVPGLPGIRKPAGVGEGKGKRAEFSVSVGAV